MLRLAAVVLAVTVAGRAAATDYWVKNGGDDHADGLMLATAWATLGRAAGVVGPDDVVHVEDGSYQGFYLDRSGTPGHPITFRAEGANVRITADNGTTPDGINLEGASHVVIDGFVVNGRTRTGIRTVTAVDVTIRNCTLGGNGRWGILTGFVDDLLIEHNEAYGSIAEHGIYVGNSGDRPVIRANHVHDNHANGIHINADASQGGDGTISNALVERNVIHGNGAGGGSGINMDGVVDSLVQNNLLYDSHASGVSLYKIDGATGSTGNVVENNTILVASDGRWCVNIADGSTGNTVRNNILWDDHSFRGAITVDAASRPGLVSDYNSVIGRFSVDGGDTVLDLPTWQGLGFDAHSFVATPAQHFLLPGSDFHLLDTSPAIDAGTSAGAPPIDLDGGARPVGASVDLGAYERQLLHCGDGTADPGERCGEPGLGCADACTTCVQCVCVTPPPTCGDALVCGSEQCEADADCGPGRVCQGCACVNAPLCASGIALEAPNLRMTASNGSVGARGEAVIPLPWTGVDPLAHGVRVRIDSPTAAGGLDVAIPSGALVGKIGWKVDARHLRWTYTDPTGAHAGVTRVTVQDRSSRQPGRLKLDLRAKAGALALPPAGSTRLAVVFGAPAECASRTFAAPGAARPRCDGGATKLSCH